MRNPKDWVMETIEVRKVDDQGRVLPPSHWRAKELGEGKEVIIMSQGDQLKIIPRKKVDLTKFFDRVDMGADGRGDWGTFESRMAEER
jgi:bifunctional DNA-binding transcriptional regulator/antitoxin component of YhaV-PrlF toxin-antitoxin module